MDVSLPAKAGGMKDAPLQRRWAAPLVAAQTAAPLGAAHLPATSVLAPLALPLVAATQPVIDAAVHQGLPLVVLQLLLIHTCFQTAFFITCHSISSHGDYGKLCQG